MKQTVVFFIAVCIALLLIGSSPSFSSQSLGRSFGKERTIIYVDGSNVHGPWEGTSEHPFQYIQDGIDASSDGDTVYVYNGTYNESLFISTSITLFGEQTTIVQGAYRPILITVCAEDVMLQNLLVQNSGGYPGNAGVLLWSPHALLLNCTFYRTRTGILTQNTSGHIFENCTFSNNGIGISLSSTSTVTVKDCTFGQNSIGIHGEQADEILLVSCYFHTNGRAGFFSQSTHLTLSHCNISDNSVNHGGMYFEGCVAVLINNNIFRHNGIAVHASRSNAIKVHQCDFTYNTHFAMVFDFACTQINITSCDIHHGFHYGVYLAKQSACRLSQNNIYSNTLYGVYSSDSDPTIKQNYWGSWCGPSSTAYGVGDWVSLPLGRLQGYPWLPQPIRDAGADWMAHPAYLNRTIQHPMTRPIHFPSNDTDLDGVPDWWETKWGYDPYVWEDHTALDPDGDALNNLEECYTDAYGSAPYQKDIFLEIDWMQSEDPTCINKPDLQLVTEATQVFLQHNISLHIDIGEYDGGEEIPYQANLSFSDLVDLYWRYFLHHDLDNPRKGIFRYGIICDEGPDVNFPFIGWDHLDSFLISAQQLSEQFPWVSRRQIILKASIHHLGHTLGLLADLHGGIDNIGTLRPFSLHWLLYRNYKSCMNYWYKYRTFSYSDGTHGYGDFDDYGHLDYGFFKNTQFDKP